MADAQDGATAPAAGLRARARRRLRDQEAALSLGDAQAQAYFSAKRLRTSRRKPSGSAKAAKRQDEHGEGDEDPDDADAADEDDEDNETLTLPPHGEIAAALQRVDADEAAGRDAAAGRAFPQFHERFARWKSELRAGNSLLMTGAGSKLSLLQEFASEALDDGYVLQVHGYLPTVSMRHLCNYLRHDVLRLKTDARRRSLVHQCRDIARLTTRSGDDARSPSEPVAYLLVHAIDGVALRSPELQTCLSWLAASPRIHLVASLEHINGCAMWKETDALRFRWLALSVSSRRPYTRELELRLVTRAQAGDLAAASGVKFILQSLTPTDVGTLREVARQQLAAAKSSSAAMAPGARRQRKAGARSVLYQSVLDACRKKLLHASVQSMKNSVKCLADHGLLRLARVQDVEHLEIPLADDVITVEILQAGEDPSRQE